MNSVSWFVYLAQVTGEMGNMFTGFGILGCVAIGICLLSRSIMIEENDIRLNIIFPQARYFALVASFFVIGNLLPEKETMLAIAASQIGEQIIKSDNVQGIANDATKALQSWIHHQIDPPKAKNDK